MSHKQQVEPLRLVVFDLDDCRYGLRLLQVIRVVRSVEWTPLPEAPSTVIGIIDVAGMVVPLLDIRRRFRLPERTISVDHEFVIARTAKRIVAIAVDRTRDIIECSAADVVAATSIVPEMGPIDGVVQLANGLVLIHDLDTFLSLDEERTLDLVLQGEDRHGI